MTTSKKNQLGSVLASPLFRRFLTPIMLIIAGFALAVYFFAVPYIKAKVYALEEKAVKTNLSNIQSLITSNYLAMQAHRKTVIEAHRREMKNIILFTEAYLKTKLEQVKTHEISEDQAQDNALEMLRSFRYGNDDFIWVADYNGFYLSHPDPKKNMQDYSQVRDVFGNYVLAPLIQKALEKEEGYHSFWDQRPNDNLPAEKLAYARVFPQWKWIIGTEVFVDDLEAEILERKEKMIDELRTILKGIVIGQTGYMYIFDAWHNIIIHPNRSLENTDMSGVINPMTKHKLVDDLVAASRTPSHTLISLGNTQTDQTHFTHRQINWVVHVDGFDWYIVAVVNTDELNESSIMLRNRILLLTGVVVALSVVLVSFLIGHLLLPVRKLSQTASLVADGDLTARCEVRGRDEIGFLSTTFNNMVGNLKSLIDDLDLKVLERTKALDAANQDLRLTVDQLEEHNREVTELNHLAERLQACHSLNETFPVVAESMAALFPGSSGCLYMAQTPGPGECFELAQTWGEQACRIKNIGKDDCLSFANYRILSTSGADSSTPRCHHLRPDMDGDSLCMPLFGQNDIIGLLHLVFPVPPEPDLTERTARHQRRLPLATSVTDHLAMAMANLKLRERLQNLSVRDGLTGLFNRRYMEETLNREFKLSERSGLPIGAIILDVDFFKKFNDTYGHEAGDIVLVELAKLLSGSVRKGDVVCRYGGEEFVIILPGSANEGTYERAEAVRARVENDLRISYQGHDIRVTISLGAAYFPKHGQTPDQVLKAADNALYASKEAGRNRATMAS